MNTTLYGAKLHHRCILNQQKASPQDGQQTGEAGSQPGPDGSAGADPNVENADFEVVDDKDKGEEKK
ncbi:MAG: hypothetical protein R3A12_05880 [Ignavibacteria bacterium]